MYLITEGKSNITAGSELVPMMSNTKLVWSSPAGHVLANTVCFHSKLV